MFFEIQAGGVTDNIAGQYRKVYRGGDAGDAGSNPVENIIVPLFVLVDTVLGDRYDTVRPITRR